MTLAQKWAAYTRQPKTYFTELVWTVLMLYLPFITVFLLCSNGRDEEYNHVQDNDISTFKMLYSHPQAGGCGKLLPLALEYRAVDNCGWKITIDPAKFVGLLLLLVARLPCNQVAVPVRGSSGGDSVMRGKIGCNGLQTGGFAIGGSCDGKHWPSEGAVTASMNYTRPVNVGASRTKGTHWGFNRSVLLLRVDGLPRERAHRLCRNQSLQRSNPQLRCSDSTN